jgi:hypothetical protein
MHGDRRPYPVMLVTLDEEEIVPWATEHGIEDTSIPAGCLWVGSQVNYWTASVSLGILTAFVVMLAALFLGLAAMKRLDGLWILARRAAGHDQREGVIGRIFAVSAAIGVVLFTIWLLIFAGLGPTLAPSGG